MDWDKARDEAVAIASGWRARDPGGAIVLFDAASIRAESRGGLASLDHGLAFTSATPCRYASISKQFLCALLAHDGAFGLDDPLGTHLDLPAAPAAVTVGQALDMTGGLPDTMATLALLGVPASSGIDRHALLRFARGLDALNFAPGSEISYANTGYRLVQAAMELRGAAYGADLATTFFAPLGLGIVLAEDESEPIPHLATGYWQSEHGWRSGRYGLHYSASGGLAGSARDLATWGQALLSGRGPAGGMLAHLTAPRMLADGTATGYGLGLARSVLDGIDLFGHGGSLPGYKTCFLLAPALGAGVAVLSNREDTDALGLGLRVFAALLGTSLPAPAASSLPDGLFVAEDGPFWLEHRAGVATFLGAAENLYLAADGFVASRPAHLPMRLAADGEAIAGEIGHVHRRFLPARPGPPDHAWAGDWTCAAGHATLSVTVASGAAHLAIGSGALRRSTRLQPLGGGRALAEWTDGPSKIRACLAFQDHALRVVTNRSRVLEFRRG